MEKTERRRAMELDIHGCSLVVRRCWVVRRPVARSSSRGESLAVRGGFREANPPPLINDAVEEPGVGAAVAKDTVSALAQRDVPLVAIPALLGPPMARRSPRAGALRHGTIDRDRPSLFHSYASRNRMAEPAESNGGALGTGDSGLGTRDPGFGIRGSGFGVRVPSSRSRIERFYRKRSRFPGIHRDR